MSRKPVAIVSAVLAAAGLAAATSGGSASSRSGSAPEAVNRADALTRAPVTNRSVGAPAYAASEARTVASARGAAIPLPRGGNFNGIRWELAGGDIAEGTMDGVLAYNAACQWLREWRQAKPVASEATPSREGALALQVLQSVPSWPALRGTESGDLLARVAAQASRGGGTDATDVLVDCDASHVRELDYAARLGLTPSR
jgi:hypothetical protein